MAFVAIDDYGFVSVCDIVENGFRIVELLSELVEIGDLQFRSVYDFS